MKLTVEQWLQRIADPVVRESALRQMNVDRLDEVESIDDAIEKFAIWGRTKEGYGYWDNLCCNPPALLPLPETLPNDNPLFKHMADNHGLTLTDSELNDIINVVKHHEALLNER